ncbi:DNA-binding response regulator [Glutamicibacter uratoxydans]|uniref:DNA-binding response regulator n=1 Tax=Glutamicibacter uratoxydans TaxID=43667 RepID=A0A4Y4DP15_GLUUR|nr:DNA-binding response regulator [Glutamicibacter uratoxydans]
MGKSVDGEAVIAVVIESDDAISDRVCGVLRNIGFVVHDESSGQRGVSLAAQVKPDLVIVGFGLPDIDGIETIRRLSSALESYVLALLDPANEIKLVQALDAGADGYCSKPLRDGEFRAQVDALMRRHAISARARQSDPGQEPQQLRHGQLTLDSSGWEVRMDGVLVALTATEFSILHVLMSAPGRVRSKRELARRVNLNEEDLDHGFVTESDVRSIEVHVANLRRKLGDSARASQWIETVRGVGYRLVNGRTSA